MRGRTIDGRIGLSCFRILREFGKPTVVHFECNDGRFLENVGKADLYSMKPTEKS